MPIYEYECGACGHRLEAFQKMSEAALTDCPECRQGALHKLVSAAGFQLKGTGWYVTDFRNKGQAIPTSTGSKPSSTETKTATTDATQSDSGSSASSNSTGSTDTKAN